MEGKISYHEIRDDLTESTSTYYFGNWKQVPVVVVKTATRFGAQFQYGSWFETKKALHYLPKVEYVFAVGVCGAITDKDTELPRVPLGDVVISSHIVGYDHKKIVDGGQINRSLTEDQRHYDFYNFISHIGNQRDWRKKNTFW